MTAFSAREDSKATTWGGGGIEERERFRARSTKISQRRFALSGARRDLSRGVQRFKCRASSSFAETGTTIPYLAPSFVRRFFPPAAFSSPAPRSGRFPSKRVDEPSLSFRAHRRVFLCDENPELRPEMSKRDRISARAHDTPALFYGALYYK